jgi:thermopsin
VAPSLASGTSRMDHTLATIERAGAPLRYAFLPNLNANPTVRSVDGHVALPYSTSPAPIGVADLGLINRSGVLVPEDVSTSQLEGVFAPTRFSGLAMDVASPDYYGVQLNAVLQDVSLFGNSSYSFWTQNVLEYSTFSQQLTLLDNVWNFSSASGALSTNAIVAHGENGTQVGTTYYYSVGPTLTIGYPFTAVLELNAGVESGDDIVFFNYTISNGSESFSGSFDYVVFDDAATGGGAPPAPLYIANGFTDNALGLPNDFEMTVGGPGGGSNFDALDAAAGMDLYYWDSATDSVQVVPSASNVGGDTGETSSGLASTWSDDGSPSLGPISGPAAFLSQGPALLQGEWNETNSTEGATSLLLRLAPENGFSFLAPGAAPPSSAYQWTPPVGPYVIPPGTYSLTSLASTYDPQSLTFSTTGSTTWVNVTLASDPSTGMYTPLWALSEPALANISSSCSGGNCTLLNDEAGALGQPADRSLAYPWFGTFNDYLYPEFPGILLWNVSRAWLSSPPALEAVTPPWLTNETARLGAPNSNNLPIFLYDDSNVRVVGGAAIGGWWFSGAYFGPSAGAASVVLWNTTGSLVANNTFLTGGGALYLYGGTNNTVVGNTFLSYYPLAPNPGSISGEAQGTTGIYDADFGNDRSAGSGCACGDLVYNNAVGTSRTAIAPAVDPYTGETPRLPFETLWNVTPRSGGNIAGGDELGGNYWWNYGDSSDPYWILPYNGSGGISVGGDAHPLLNVPLVTVTFSEEGLPVGTPWEVGIGTSTGTATNESSGTSLTEEWASGGDYYLTANSLDHLYGIPNSQVLYVGGSNFTEILHFYPLYWLTFQAVNLPNSGFWVVTFDNPAIGSWIDLGNVVEFPPQSLALAVYNFTVTPPAGYSASPAGGTVDMDENRTITIQMSQVGSPGQLTGSVSPSSGASLWVDNQSVSLGSGGTFSLSLPAGLHSVEATAPGYQPYFNNVTINGGGTTPLAIVLDLTVNGTGAGPSASDAYLIWVALGVGILAAILAGTTLVYYRRSRLPPSSPE